MTIIFQSTLPCGSDASALSANYNLGISIHAPLRERPKQVLIQYLRGISIHAPLRERLRIFLNWALLQYFNPRSLAGATTECYQKGGNQNISIHAPLRERRKQPFQLCALHYFNPRSLAGATGRGSRGSKRLFNFNPRSLAGATKNLLRCLRCRIFQSTLPCGSDWL